MQKPARSKGALHFLLRAGFCNNKPTPNQLQKIFKLFSIHLKIF